MKVCKVHDLWLDIIERRLLKGINRTFMRIIIPMTGYGSRFVAAGYKELKPLIRVQGRPIIEWIVKGMYTPEDEFIFVCRQEHLENIAEMRTILLGVAPNVKILSIDKWKKLGPVADVMRIADNISDDEPCIVTYCDVYLRWDYEEFKRQVSERGCDGAVVCWTGFNPSTIPESNVFATCLVGNNGELISIREKYDYETDRTLGHFSAGVYYYRTGAIMKDAFQALIEAEDMVNGEYYVSLSYNYMKRSNLHVWVTDNCRTFCNWGTPKDMEDYNFWITQISEMNRKLNILIPMAGAGQRFVKAGYKIHKPILPIIDRKNGNTMPMVCSAVSDLPGVERDNTTLIFVDRQFHVDGGVENEIRKYYPKAQFVTVEQLTEGQACTCLLAKNFINNSDELLISACDNGIQINQNKFMQLKTLCDVIVFTYKSLDTRNNPNAYGWVKVDENNNAIEVSCKRAISDTPERDHAIVATFWFREGSIFVNASERMLKQNDRVNDEFYVDEAINHVIAMGYRVKVFQVDKYICWGTPADYEGYMGTIKYWNEYYNSASYLGEKHDIY